MRYLHNDRWVLAQCEVWIKIQHKSTEMQQHKAADVTADAGGTASEDSEVLGAYKAAVQKVLWKRTPKFAPIKTRYLILSMTLSQILILSVIQGATELLPVSSSAHVIVAEKLMGLDPTTPEMTILLVMLHTGTMFAVIVFFWRPWQESFFSSKKIFWESVKLIVAATLLTGIVGLSLKFLIERFIMKDVPHAEIEQLFGNMNLISAALAAVGLLILFTGVNNRLSSQKERVLGLKESCYLGAIQGICLPFRGFSRSGATISTGLLLGIPRKKIEAFSFALAVVLTPPIIVRESMRLLQEQHPSSSSIAGIAHIFMPSLIGMVFSFIAGLLALKWLSNWLESGRWPLFGLYCLGASVIVFMLHRSGI